jgi:hypothetical protein
MGEYFVLTLALVFVLLLNWNSKRSPLHMIWAIPVGFLAFAYVLSLLQ